MLGPDERNAVVFALCHEVGNLVGATRLNAHLIDVESSGIELATASVEIDDSSARICSLLALVRPVLTVAAEGDGVSAGTLVRGVAEALEEYGGRGVVIEVEAEEALPRIPGRLEPLHHLVTSFGYYAVEEARPKGRVWVRAAHSDGRVVFRIEDNGSEREGLGEVGAGAPTGRTLVYEVAKIVLGTLGGGVDVGRAGDVTWIELSLPVLD